MRKQLLATSLIVVALALALTPGTATAQSCGYSRSYQSSYQSYQSYHVPSYSYAPAVSYGRPTYQARTYYEAPKVYKDEYVPTYYRFVLALPVANLPTYGATYSEACPSCEGGAATPQRQTPNPTTTPQRQPGGPDPFQEAVLKRLDNLDKKIDNVNERLVKLERTREPLKLPKEDGKGREGKEELLPPPEPEKGQAKADADFLKVSGESCAACHSRSNAAKYGGDFVFSEDDGRMAVLTAEQREAVEVQIGEGKMPRLNTKRAKDSGVKALTQQTADVLFLALDRQKKNVRAQKAPKEKAD